MPLQAAQQQAIVEGNVVKIVLLEFRTPSDGTPPSARVVWDIGVNEEREVVDAEGNVTGTETVFVPRGRYRDHVSPAKLAALMGAAPVGDTMYASMRSMSYDWLNNESPRLQGKQFVLQ